MELTDGDRIRGLLGSYCRLIDAGDFAGLGTLFARASLCDADGTALARGPEEVAALYRGTTRLHEDGTPGTQHLVLNTTFADPAPDGSVVATSNYVVFQAVAGLPLQPVVTGGYVDTFAPEGGWHFRERRFALGLIGDVSRHLLIGNERGER